MLGGENLLGGCLIVRTRLRLGIPRLIHSMWRDGRRGGYEAYGLARLERPLRELGAASNREEGSL
jgi:hypothetical protein